MKFTARLLFVPLFIGLIFFTLPLVRNTDAQARDMKEMSLIIKKPIIIKGGLSERMNVSFPHSRHKTSTVLPVIIIRQAMTNVMSPVESVMPRPVPENVIP